MAGGEIVVGALGALIAIGIVGSLFFRRTGINDVMLLILLGIGIGPLTGIVDANALAPFVPPIGAVALLMVVFSEGLNLSFDNLRDNAFDVLLLGALCFALTFGGSFAVLYFAFSWKLLDALLLAAILCASAPEIIAIVTEEMKMGNKLRQIAKLEAVLADSAAVIVAFSLLGLVGTTAVGIDAQQIAYMAIFVAMLSVVIGALSALAWQFLISAMYKKYAHLSALAIACFLFAASGLAGGNGVLAVFTFGFFIGNRKEEETLKLFQEEFAFLIRTFFFVYLGMLFVPAQFANGFVLLAGLALAVVAIGARRIAVAGFSFFQPAAREDKVLGSLVQRGLSVAVLASIAAAAYAHVEVAPQAAVSIGQGATQAALDASAAQFGNAGAQAAVNATAGAQGAVGASAIQSGAGESGIPPFAPIALVVVFVTNLFSTVGVFRHERAAEKIDIDESSSLAGSKKRDRRD